eukprot:15266018-Heterocapsa_arctica.AAC.1
MANDFELLARDPHCQQGALQELQGKGLGRLGFATVALTFDRSPLSFDLSSPGLRSAQMTLRAAAARGQ